MAGNILHECAAKEDVEKLAAAADGKDGLLRFGKALAKRHFGLVTEPVGWVGAANCLAVVAGVDIAAACQNKGIKAFFSLIAIRGKRLCACRADGIGVGFAVCVLRDGY